MRRAARPTVASPSGGCRRLRSVRARAPAPPAPRGSRAVRRSPQQPFERGAGVGAALGLRTQIRRQLGDPLVWGQRLALDRDPADLALAGAFEPSVLDAQ